MTIYNVDGQEIEAASAEDAVRLDLTEQAKRDYGPEAFCYNVKFDSWSGDDMYYEGVIVRPCAGQYEVLQNNVQRIVFECP